MATRYITRACRNCGTRTSGLLETRQPGDGIGSGNPVFYEDRTAAICVACRGCGRPVPAKMVKGKRSERHICGAKCLASTGPSCECSCGGKNHGAGYSAAVAA